MVKTSKFILALIILIISVLLVGCLFFTGNRLANYPDKINSDEKDLYEDKDTYFQFWEDGIWYQDEQEDFMFLETKNYEEGVLTATRHDKEYRFVVIDEDTIYDESSSSLLIRRGV